MKNEIGLWVEQGGSGDPVFLLLHGRGCTGAVWTGVIDLIEKANAGSWIAPDFPGHGRSAARPSYADGRYATDIATAVPVDRPVIILGHSLGGVIATVLATGWFGIDVRAVVAFSVKFKWTEAEREKSREFARKPIRWFETRAEALDRYLLVSGLKGLVDVDAPETAGGIAEGEGGFRLAVDPMTTDRGRPSAFETLLGLAGCPIVLASGGADTMAPIADVRQLDPAAIELPGLVHNAHVQDPAAVWALAEPFL